MPVLTFHGHACFEVVHGETRILIDPFLSGNPKADVGPDDLGPVTAVVLSHGHGDHLGDAIPLCRRDSALLVATFELATFCASRGVEHVHPMHIGGAHAFQWGRVKLVPAFHGGAVEGDESGRFTTNPAGIVLTLGGTTIYHTGDTGLTVEMQLLEGRVDVMLCPIGDNFTMGVDDAVRAVGFVRPRIAIPMHYDTWEVVAADPRAFATGVGSLARVEILDPGQSVTVP